MFNQKINKMNTKTTTIKAFSNTEIIGNNAFARLQDKFQGTSIDMATYKLCLAMANEVIKEMEKQGVTTYEGSIDDN